MQHNLFKPRSFEEGKHAVVGDCNGFTMQQRWDAETPAFAKKIASFIPKGGRVLDYGCGVGRIARAILSLRPDVTMRLVDESADMRKAAMQYCGALPLPNTQSTRSDVKAWSPKDFRMNMVSSSYDVVYCVYVLQHIPAIEIRDALRTMEEAIKPDGTFVYCSSDYRMAIRFDGKGFFDDSVLGVNLQDEVSHFFVKKNELFEESDYSGNEVLKKMITGGTGGLPHPAFVYKSVKSKGCTGIFDPDHGAVQCSKPLVNLKIESNSPQKIILVNDQSPGDVLLTSIAIRSLHAHHPGKYITDMRSPCNELFMHNPHITHIVPQDQVKEREIIELLKKDDTLGPQRLGDVLYIIAHYPEIHKSGMTGIAFMDAHRMFLAQQLNIAIPSTGLFPDIFFGAGELETYFQHSDFAKLKEKPYWVINAGIKNCFTTKQYPYYQQVVDLLKDKITFVQIGHLSHNHKLLNGVIDLRGKTNLRQLCALIHEADGVLTAISFPMHAAAAFKKPCVIPAGAREGARWEFYPNQRYLCNNGSLSCAPDNGDGCWVSKIENCKNKSKNGNAMCMELIYPETITDAILSYYTGGRVLSNGKRSVFDVEVTAAKVNTELSDLYKKVEHATIAPAYIDNTQTEPSGAVVDFKCFKCDEKYMSTIGQSNKDELSLYRTPQVTAAIMNIIRILKGVTPEDTWYEAYRWHYEKRKEQFMDIYHFLWYLGSIVQPKSILEVGCRTGISICQLLSAYIDTSIIDRIVLMDIFTDGLCSPGLIVKHLDHLNLSKSIESKLSILTGDSAIELPRMIEAGMLFSYILIDGDHEKSHALLDLNNAAILLEVGGHIVFDDIAPDGCNLQDVWDNFKSAHNNFTYWENYDGKGIGYARRVK